MRITWDEPKRERNLKEHGVEFADVRDRFDFGIAIIRPTYAGRDGRPRFMAFGPLDGTSVAVIFSMLGTEAISIISVRHASRKERKLYDQT